MTNSLNALRVRIILSPDNASWIIEKMAHRLVAGAALEGVVADIGSEIDPHADVNHWMSYAFANVTHVTPTSMLITHLDDPYKVQLVRSELLNGVDVGICLSSHTRDILAGQRLPPSCLAYVVPGHDFAVSPRRIVIGITTRLYADGRKREHMLVKLARHMDLGSFRFEIFGHGWEHVIPALEGSGAEVFYRPGTEDYVSDYQEMIRHIQGFDYYLYLGRDEGSLGTLDALGAGVKTIITPQGFHVDLPNGISFPVWEQEDLDAVFVRLADDRQKLLMSVSPFTWQNYARAHAVIWTALAEGRKDQIADELQTLQPSTGQVALAKRETRLALWKRTLSPYRIRSALSHVPALKPIRKWIKQTKA